MRPRASRRRFLAIGVAAGAVGGAGCAAQQTGGPSDGDGADDGSQNTDAQLPNAVGVEPIVTGLEQPVDAAFAPDADRRYVVERDGVVYVHEADGLRETPFLDLRESIVTGGERGLLGLTLHPEFAQNRRLFVRYSAPVREGTPADYSHTGVLAEFRAAADGRSVEPGSERTILELPQPGPVHNAGDLAFGPEGLLYVPNGTSGGGEAAQNVSDNYLGCLLRIDVDAGGAGAYGVPEDNPLVGRAGREEYYAWGFRNPWRLSFDGDDLYVADVGHNRYEEVNLVEKGGNYGWNVKEGTHCFRAEECPDGTPEDVRGGEPFLDPIVEYPHSGAPVSGAAVIGGAVYRGSAVPELQGVYVFGDFQAQGRLFAATPSDADQWPTGVVEISEGDRLQYLLAFERYEGEVYALGTGRDGGGLFRIAASA
ncbi:Glucose/arabinose dehydrogenase, beta-propeller fold [Natronoarchaeum philippinense]|uniref:Glucose/arabinose dehydrogenase, beta-propeller fold n=1 Tax=Natronoarchaeum philippinense TaxID=558529 RepID=A0A285NUG7_NATPI|nr:PQQ-dependent sugar dehydrogenase [Natronoarchaeum philippinense]SNZ12563.1 Glucose/arabinose dehydrogenase, beta-propeller fold [Natronoarchaeum philippinense]